MMISFDDFQQLELKVGRITKASYIEDADKLLLLEVSLGEETRQVVSGIRSIVDDPEELIDTQVVLVANLEAKEIFGHESQGMILAARDGDDLSLVTLANEMPDGTKVK